MRVNVTDTGQFFMVEGVRCRRWVGRTDSGRLIALYTRAVGALPDDMPAIVEEGLEWFHPDHSAGDIKPIPEHEL